MRSNLKVLVAAVAAVLVAPQVSMAAEDIDSQLQLMNERMSQLETQLQATQDELDASKSEVARQSDMIEKAGIERPKLGPVASGLGEVFHYVVKGSRSPSELRTLHDWTIRRSS